MDIIKGVINKMNFDERLMKAETSDELKKMKIWMFQEQVRIQAQKDEFIELAQELQKEKRAIERERDALNKRIKMEEKRFQNNEMLISKKQKIIEDAFRQLSVDKKVLECERLNFEYEKNKYRRQRTSNTARNQNINATVYEGCVFFGGITNELALRKRYKELMKIFHPDNVCGDTNTLLRIQAEYENIKRKYSEA